ncbi:MAG TPA: DNA-3-methyladenine glycosylase 2 family protein [Gemmatimonadaceae bacterium]|nr:DNA-3-methyladenine glycosylase 2 family protein [Gemmatimonadaceae bacterium]
MHRRAITHLRRDPVLARLMADVGPCRFAARSEGSHFDHILRAIVYQQLSGRAAATIHGRLVALLDGTPSAARLLAATDEQLRAAGLSRQKIGYLRDLANRVLSGELPVEQLHELDDERVIAALTAVKGIGRWTAHMFLMFRLGRPDVLPELDLGIRKAIQVAYRLRKMPNADRVHAIGAAWAPHRTVASWYLWRSIDQPAARAKKKSRPAKAAKKKRSRRARSTHKAVRGRR